jgi:hypothetical protein
MDNDSLADFVIEGVKRMRPTAKATLELRKRFTKLRGKDSIHGYRKGQWTKFCKERLGMSDRNARRLIEATGEENPAAKHDGSNNRGNNGGSDSRSVDTATDAEVETATSAEKHPQRSPKRVYMHDPNAKTIGDYHRRDITSLFHKDLRRGDEESALFSASELDLTGLRGHVWNTLIVAASEDVGLADNNLTVQLQGLFKSSKTLGDDVETARIFLVHAVQLVARAKKSRVADEALCTLYGDAIPESKAESLLVEVVKLDKEGRSGEAWNKMRLIAKTANAEVSVQVHALYEHWKRSAGKEHEASEDGAQNRIFFVHAALICARAEKTRQTERIYADRAKRDLPDYAKDYHSWTGKKELGRKRDSAEGVRHFLEEGSKLENEDTSIPNPYRPYFLEWIWSKVKKAPASDIFLQAGECRDTSDGKREIDAV